MPKNIDCPDCEEGEIFEETGVRHPVTGMEEILIHICGNCKNGKITVYTQAEVNQAVKEEREARAVVCDLINLQSDSNDPRDYAEAIRNRNKEIDK